MVTMVASTAPGMVALYETGVTLVTTVSQLYLVNNSICRFLVSVGA